MADTTMGQRIAEQRKLLGISQETLGDRLGVSRQAISKWEADGAVPEVDKLIALSRQFSVSVGWLLGVEGDPAENRGEALSDKQMEMLEDILHRSQRPEQMEAPKWYRFRLIGALCVAILAFALSIWGNLRGKFAMEALTADYESKMERFSFAYADLDGKVAGLTEDNAALRGRLDAIADQISDLAASDAPLISFSLSANIWDSGEEGPYVQIAVTAIPKTLLEGDTAALILGPGGAAKHEVSCNWDGSAYQGWLLIPVDQIEGTNYHYRFVLTHADGTQELQILEPENPYVTNLSGGLMFKISGDVYREEDGLRYDVHIITPALLGNAPGDRLVDAFLQMCDLVLYQGPEELQRISLIEERNIWDNAAMLDNGKVELRFTGSVKTFAPIPEREGDFRAGVEIQAEGLWAGQIIAGWSDE